MDDVSRDRGQLIVITGLVLAVVLVATVLVLNTTIYTENLAARGTTDGDDAVRFRATVIADVAGIIAEETDTETTDEGIHESIQRYAQQVERHAIEDAIQARVTATDVEDSTAAIEIRYRTSRVVYEDEFEVDREGLVE